MKYLCTGPNCGVYVFGTSTGGICPSCYEPGHQTTLAAGEDFVRWFHKAQQHSSVARETTP